MDITKVFQERIVHELDMDLLREIEKVTKVDLSKEINLAERKFNDKLDRVLNNINHELVHKTNE